MTFIDAAITVVAAVVATTVIHRAFWKTPEVGNKRARDEDDTPYPGKSEPPVGTNRVVFGGIGGQTANNIRKVLYE